MQYVVLIIFIIAPILMGTLLLRTYRTLKRYREAWDYLSDGEVTGKRKWSKRQGRNRNDTVRTGIRYVVDGERYESYTAVGESKVLRKGRIVGVYYNPENPEEIIVDTFAQRGTPFLLAGYLFIGIGLVILLVSLNVLLLG